MRYLAFLAVLLCLTGWGPFSFFQPANTEPPGSHEWLNREVQLINSQASNFNPEVLRLSLIAYLKARNKGLVHKPLLTVIDYSKPSSERRLLVIDLKNDRVLFNTYVTHGKNSGNLIPTSFSNQPGSLKSSIGVFETTDSPYVGNNGYSLRLRGLEQGINDNAYERAIVIHGAWYADSSTIRRYGQLGRSWGCPAVSDRLARPLINTIKERTLVFVYSNSERRWLHRSTFLVG
jgi:hypothetical protein